MKYLQQVSVILLFSLLGEFFHSFLPLPVPASVYGLVLLFLALLLRIVRLEQVKESGNFLVGIMSVLFVCPVVGLLDCWGYLLENLPGFCIVVVVSLLLTFLVSGKVTQLLLERGEKEHAGISDRQ